MTPAVNSLLSLLLPEAVLILGGAVVLMVGLSRKPRLRSSACLFALAVVCVGLAVTSYIGQRSDLIFNGLHISAISGYVRFIGLSVGLLVLLIHWHLPRDTEQGDMFGMILFSLAGVLLTALADDLVLLFLAIELVSVPTYVLVSVGRSDIRAQEAGVKYFYLGAMSAALLAYGFSFLYGISGTTYLSEMTLQADAGYATLGLLLAFAGIAFKIAAVPFHVYAADVYQGAASPDTGLLGFFPKLAGFVALTKLLLAIQPTGLEATGWDLPGAVFVFLWVVSAATMTVGNVLGLIQQNVKRMLAYSSIAHSGYMLLGLLVGPVIGSSPLQDGLSAMFFYIVIYGVMNLGAFAALALVQVRTPSKHAEEHPHPRRAAEQLSDLAGLARRQPMVAFAMAICVFSLMGMPPTAGFLGKVYLFSSALSAGAEHPYQKALIVLAIIGVVNSAIAAVYYLRIVAACYLMEPKEEITLVPRRTALQIGLLGCCMTILVIGFWPSGLVRRVPRSSSAVVVRDASTHVATRKHAESGVGRLEPKVSLRHSSLPEASSSIELDVP